MPALDEVRRPYSPELLSQPELIEAVKAELPNREFNNYPATLEEIPKVCFLNFDAFKANREAYQQLQFTLMRDEATSAAYREHKQSIRGQMSHDEYETHIRENTLQGERFAIIPDEFPKFAAPDTLHYNLWIADTNTEDDELAIVVATWLKDNNLTTDDIVLFEGPAHLRSVEAVRHMHIYIRGRKID